MSERSPHIHGLPCCACVKHGVKQFTRTEEHHLLSGSHRRGDDFSIPLCAWHHRGEPPAGFGATSMAYVAGPSFARSSKKFRQAYGTDDDLLEQTNQKLGLTTALNGGW